MLLYIQKERYRSISKEKENKDMKNFTIEFLNENNEVIKKWEYDSRSDAYDISNAMNAIGKKNRVVENISRQEEANKMLNYKM